MAYGRCTYDVKYRQGMVIYELKSKETGKSHIGKTQLYLKDQTKQHVNDVWKVIKSGRVKFGPNWYGSRGYARVDAFSKHFGNLCKNCKNSNAPCKKMKKIMTPIIL